MERKIFVVVFAVLVAAHILVIGTSRLLPFIDLPYHLAASTIYRDYDDPANDFSRYYDIDLFPKPNVFHLLFCSLRVFPSVEAANKVYYALYVFLLPLSIVLLIVKAGGSRWLALLSFPFIYNFSACWGFAGYTMAIPVFFLIVYFLLDFEKGGWRRATGVAVLLLLLFFIHAQVMLLAVLVFLVFCFVRRGRDVGGLIRDLAVIAPAACITALWLPGQLTGGGAGIYSSLLRFYREEALNPIYRLRALFLYDNYFLFAGRAGRLTAGALALAAIAPALILLVRRRSEARRHLSNRRVLPLYLLCALLVLLYFVLPFNISGYHPVYVRFSVFCLLSLVTIGGVLAGRRTGTPGRIFPCLVVAVHLVLWAAHYNAFNSECSGFTKEFLPDESRGTRLAGLVYDPEFRGQPLFMHFPNYYIVWNRGIASTSLTAYRYGPVRCTVGLEVLPPYNEWLWSTGGFDERYERIEYLLVRGAVPENHLPHFREHVLMRHTPRWSLHGKIEAQN